MEKKEEQIQEYCAEEEIFPLGESAPAPSYSSETVRRAMGGDKDAFSTLFMATYRQMYYVARQYLREDADVYDALQTGYAKAYKYMSRLTTSETFYPWLKKIIENAARDVRADLHTHGMIPCKKDGEGYTPDDSEDSDRRADIREVLSRMDPKRAQVLALYFYDGIKLSEIARMLGEPPSTVRSRFHAAKKELTGLLKEKGIDRSLYSGSLSAMIAASLRLLIGTNILSAATAQQMLDEILSGSRGKLQDAAYSLLEKRRNQAILKAVSLLMAFAAIVSCITAVVVFSLKDWGESLPAAGEASLSAEESADPNNAPAGPGTENPGGSDQAALQPDAIFSLGPAGSANAVTPGSSASSYASGGISGIFPGSSSEGSSGISSKPSTGSSSGTSSSKPSTSGSSGTSSKPSTGGSSDTSDTGDDFVPDYLPGQANTTMRYPNNLALGGYIDQQGDWIYFVRRDYDQKYFLEKIRKDGAGRVVLFETRTSIFSLNVIGDWIYYVEPSNGIYRIRTDGKKREQLVKGAAYTSLYYVDGTLYYAIKDSAASGSIWRYETANSRTEKLVSNLHEWRPFYNDGQYILYCKEDGYVWIYSLSSGNIRRAFSYLDTRNGNILLDGNYAYWSGPEGIMRINYTLPNSQPVCVYHDNYAQIMFLNVFDHQLGFTVGGDIVLCLLDTSSLQSRSTGFLPNVDPAADGYCCFEAGYIWGGRNDGVYSNGCARVRYDGSGYEEFS
ncbi:MAG TPA: sigma-70 family RNA polymerase sigma factor [Firmicutes bacterium]|nr:sigma-70 family RNA polymerase sigma factor [Bacillota bacterium]